MRSHMEENQNWVFKRKVNDRIGSHVKCIHGAAGEGGWAAHTEREREQKLQQHMENMRTYSFESAECSCV